MLSNLVQEHTKNSRITKVCYVGPELNATKFVYTFPNLKDFKNYTKYDVIDLLTKKTRYDVVILDVEKNPAINLFSVVLATCRLVRMSGFFVVLCGENNKNNYSNYIIQRLFRLDSFGNFFEMLDYNDQGFYIFKRTS